MDTYTYNRACSCPRCRVKGLMGAAILVTLGALFLFNEFSIFSFGQGIPLLLIVIGIVMYLGRSAPTEGHVEPSQPQPPTVPPPPPGANQQGQEMNR